MKTRFIKIISLTLAVVLLMCGALTGCTDDTPQPKDPNASGIGDVSDDKTQAGDKKRIAFTFDDGPQAPAEDLEEGYYPYTMYILDKLEQLGMKATFFVVGTRALTYQNAIRRASGLGCEIGMHTYAHDQKYSTLDNAAIKADMDKTKAAIAASGVTPTLFRPLGGSINSSQLEYIASMGYSTIGWSIDTLDYDGRPKTGDKFAQDSERNAKYESFVNAKVDLIMSQAKDGEIILMHDIYMSSVDIFKRAADKLIAEGYELVTVSELLALNGKQPAPVMHLSKNNSITYMP